ncbi:60S ribosomal L5 [Paramuricea clavata]|uniref:60S ribosomal L5 n=1 Tax=Paramuricea clavata TaxID=317549 RepID=A0A6S7K062_PARCT|nr:60S ribosomal L5 [Paramuricea clavata]
MEEMYKKAHAATRSDPSAKQSPAPREGKPKRFGRSRLSLQQRKDLVAQKKKIGRAQAIYYLQERRGWKGGCDVSCQLSRRNICDFQYPGCLFWEQLRCCCVAFLAH